METTLTEKAMQLVIMDAISNGHTDKDAMIEYMASETFKKSVKYYVDMFKAEFAKQRRTKLKTKRVEMQKFVQELRALNKNNPHADAIINNATHKRLPGSFGNPT